MKYILQRIQYLAGSVLKWQSSGPRNQSLVTEFSCNPYIGAWRLTLRPKHKHPIITILQLDLIVAILLLGWISFCFRRLYVSFWCLQIMIAYRTSWWCYKVRQCAFCNSWDFCQENAYPNFKFPIMRTRIKRAAPGILFLEPETISLLAKTTYWTSHTFNCFCWGNQKIFHVGVWEPCLESYLSVWHLNGLWD